jgi:hypothetical protein
MKGGAERSDSSELLRHPPRRFELSAEARFPPFPPEPLIIPPVVIPCILDVCSSVEGNLE